VGYNFAFEVFSCTALFINIYKILRIVNQIEINQS
jgi:hypothetical protein